MSALIRRAMLLTTLLVGVNAYATNIAWANFRGVFREPIITSSAVMDFTHGLVCQTGCQPASGRILVGDFELDPVRVGSPREDGARVIPEEAHCICKPPGDGALRTDFIQVNQNSVLHSYRADIPGRSGVNLVRFQMQQGRGLSKVPIRDAHDSYVAILFYFKFAETDPRSLVFPHFVQLSSDDDGRINSGASGKESKYSGNAQDDYSYPLAIGAISLIGAAVTAIGVYCICYCSSKFLIIGITLLLLGGFSLAGLPISLALLTVCCR